MPPPPRTFVRRHSHSRAPTHNGSASPTSSVNSDHFTSILEEQTNAPSPMSRACLESDLGSAKSIITRLRLDRNHWCTLAKQQEKNLDNAGRLERVDQEIANPTALNEDLEERADFAVITEKSLLAKYRDVVTKHDKLVNDVNEADRTILQLKKSDRAKEKVHQRNLHLKSLIGRKTNKEELLLEALSAAVERVAELEAAGEKLIDTLEEERVRSSGGSGRSEGEEIRFRGILDDDEWEEKREIWNDLLDEES
ncbi:uncharacterized protein BDR25DRAFT_214325 [Lindgomyces ingoldianus]|uniref:Uncharacterized protein n=1 Tax=Lindgomyces ingoldianus TaxID=673940 RepID=A0ACB6R6K9_9PLEO|nr:uncharacterized protein BDR25DRAFT_214325 [Lindgomyces ingoldianus]KAF2474934.1 hypothetical protein BDR25DRAFT_214325 [Lindgomyces ingoldianus]